MRFISFRIKNFRSIKDTGVVNFSADNVTALVGQNESGKTAVLEALATTLSNKAVVFDDLRHDEPLPEIQITSQWSEEEVLTVIQKITDEESRMPVLDALKKTKFVIKWTFKTSFDTSSKSGLSTAYELEGLDIKGAIQSRLLATKGLSTAVTLLLAMATKTPPPDTPEYSMLESAEKIAITSEKEFIDALYEAERSFVLFEEHSGLLPDRIEITDELTLKVGVGWSATRNFLTIAKIDLMSLLKSDTRAQAATLNRANKLVTNDLLEFWSQNLGQQSKLRLECAVHRHEEGHERAGKSYLEFLILDDAATLYPKQRSRGTRWFMSFFLQLRASEMRTHNTVFLLDEPGSNLHEKAQDDVLTLIENIREKIGIVYSTHSPHLINEKFFHRILAVERDSSKLGHPTRVIGAHALGAASTDTLSPIFTAMGVSLSRQTTIKKKNNVILEELSSYYYLKAFWKLAECKQEVHFLPATGTSNVITFAQLFIGWGLDFLAVVDDEPSGRAVYKQLKRDLYLDDESWASKRLLKITSCEGVEDVLDPVDYKTYILELPDIELTQGNAKWAKTNGAAKAIHGLKFLQKIERNELSMNMLQPFSRERILDLVSRIETRLRDYSC